MAIECCKKYTLQVDGLNGFAYSQADDLNQGVVFGFETAEKADRFAKKVLNDFSYLVSPFCKIIILNRTHCNFILKPIHLLADGFKEETIHNILFLMDAAYVPDKGAPQYRVTVPVKKC